MSDVSGLFITITPTSIANEIKCEDEGVTLDMLFLDSSFPPHLIFDNLSDLSKVSNLNFVPSNWYQILILNFLPNKKNLEFLDIDEKVFALLLNSGLKINLSHIMFEYLKTILISFHEWKSCFIPYGWVLSELFYSTRSRENHVWGYLTNIGR